MSDESPKLAAIYLRVSTEDQAESGLGLEAQEAACRAYCKIRGYTVAGVYREEAVSGRVFPLARPAFGALMELVSKRPETVIVAHAVSRLSRRQSHIWKLLDDAGQYKLKFVAASEPFDTATPIGRATLGMLAVWAQLEADMISDRTRAALRAAKARGVRLGAKPLSELNPELADLIQRMHFDLGKSAATIAFELNLRGVPTARGKRWHPTTIQRVLGQKVANGRDIRASGTTDAAGTEVEPQGATSDEQPAATEGSDRPAEQGEQVEV